jgi:phenylacetate-CoA ligase
MRRMAKITGRSDDMLIIRGVNLFPSQVEEMILSLPALAPHYQLEITRPAQLDELTIHVERQPTSGLMDGENAGRKLEHTIKAYVGISAQVVIETPGSIERSVGKARRIIDRRPKE